MLQRFLDAQSNSYNQALREITAGQKVSHWMWYIFPQIRGLGRSETAQFYGIVDLQEAIAYAQDPILGPRLTEICDALLAHYNKDAVEIFGFTDARKLQSSMTLFSVAAPDCPVFSLVLNLFFDGKQDQNTLRLLKRL